MTIRLSRQQHDQLLEWAREADSEECCGLILANGLWLTANVAPNRERQFEIEPKALIEAEKAARSGGPAIIGYFHSHPNGLARPSAEDENAAIDDGRIWLIIARDAVSAWRKNGAAGFAELSLVIEG